MKILGIIMLALPFIALGVFIIKTEGWKGFAFVYGGTALIIAWVIIAAYLIDK